VNSDSIDLRLLPEERVRLLRVAGVLRLELDGERCWLSVAPARAFPASDPDHYVAFLDGAGKDIGVIRDPALMDAESRKLLEEELAQRYFVPVVLRVIRAKEEFGSVYWTVET